MSNLFQNLELAAFKKGITPRSAESRAWFQKQAAKLGKVNRSQLMKEPELQLTGRQVLK